MSTSLRLAVLTCGYFVIASATIWLTRFNGGVALVWIASAVLTAFLVLNPPRHWGKALLCCAAASTLATALFGLGPAAAPFLAVINVTEAAIAATLLLRWIGRPGDFASISEVARFGVAVGVAAAATSPFGALVATTVSGTVFAANALGWFTGHTLGALTVLPFALLLGRGEIGDWLKTADRRTALEGLALFAATVLIAALVFSQTRVPLLFLPVLPALFATFRLGRAGAVTSVLALLMVAAPFTIAGSGPLALGVSKGFDTQFFQFYLAVIVLTVLPAAAELQNRKQLYSALRDSETRYRLLAENTRDLIVHSDLDTTRRYVSPASWTLLGYLPEELVGTRPLDFVHPDDREGYAALLSGLGEGRIKQATTRRRYRRKDGSWIWLEVAFSLTYDERSGVANGYVASLRDVSERWKAEEALRVSEERLALALEGGSDGVWDWDFETGELQLSDMWFARLGYHRGEVDPHVESIQSLFHPDDLEASRRHMVDHLKGATPVMECELRLRSKDGDWLWTLARGRVVSRTADGQALRMVGTYFDITRRKEAELQIEHMAHHDALTGLPNRALFQDRLRATAMDAARCGRQFALLACDLDRFKAVNDTRGHSAGDAVLRVVADRLTAVLRADDLVARLGGDEFAILLSRIDRRDDAAHIAQRVIDIIGEPIVLEDQEAQIGVSVGVALGQGDPGDQIFKNADMALYEAKACGRSVFRFFEPGMDTAFIARSRLEDDLRTAVRDGALTLAYQPILTLGTGETDCLEALMRWNHPARGVVSPAAFVPVAEDTGLIVPMGAWALRQACAEAASWPKPARVAVNVSAVQFQRAGLEQSVRDALSASGLPPERLELEITESVLMQDAVGVVSTLMRLRALGVRIALDDFGTGYSSLSYLRRFPFNKIKIDRSFIVEIEDPDVAAIVRAIVGLGERSGATITAEGVETARQLARVREEGCNEVQGYHFSRPLSAAAARAFLAAETGADRAEDAGPRAANV